MTEHITQTADGIDNDQPTNTTMTTKTDYTPTAPNYKWELMTSTDWIKNNQVFLIELEKYISSASESDQIFYEIVEVFKKTERPVKVPYREFFSAITYLAIYKRDPSIAPIDLVSAAGNEFSKADLMETAGKIQYEVDIYNPFVYLQRLTSVSEEEREEIHDAISSLPFEIREEHEDRHELVVGAAMTKALDDPIEKICYDRLNGNVLPETLEDVVAQFDDRTFEEKWAEWEAGLDGDLREEFDTVDLETAKLAVTIEDEAGVGRPVPKQAIDETKLPFPVDEHIRALKEIDMTEEEDGTVQLTRSCFQ